MAKRAFLAWVVLSGRVLWGQSPLDYSVATPRPINPAEGTTNPGALATQRQNPYLGSVPAPATTETLRLTLQDVIARGLRFNLRLIESNEAGADTRALRLRALSALLPQISANGKQAYEALSFKEIGLNLPPIPGVGSLPPTSGGFGYQDARVGITQSIFDGRLRQEYKASQLSERAAAFDIKDARDVVVYAVGTAYLQVVASQARVEAAQAQLASAQELDRQTANRVKSEVAPEIDSLRAQVELQSVEQRLTNVRNQLEKDKLTLARITGLAVEQKFELVDRLAYRPLTGLSSEAAIEQATQARADLASAESNLRAAERMVRAQKAQRLPVIGVEANYGGAGVNIGNFNQVYSIAGSVSVPIYTGGRIRADIEQAEADLARRRAEYADLRGRIAYDVRIAWLDANASESSVRVAQRNQELAGKALTQAEDRYANGVTNYLEVVQAQETVSVAADNYIQSLFSFDTAVVSLARAMGTAETRVGELLGGK